jgi:pyrroloquinoline quinone (PQQ) biosynthesis protein C
MTATIAKSLSDRLYDSEAHRRFAAHPFFSAIKSEDQEVTVEQVGIFLGQWWHPLHYFTTFLARSVATMPDVASKSAITLILNQEAGGGAPERAHETIFHESLAEIGFPASVTTGTTPYEETVELVRGYEEASYERYNALGFIFATEVTDLLMVSSIGAAVHRVTGTNDNLWVKIHVSQEPDHVEEAESAMLQGFDPAEEQRILDAADRMWTLWTAFFDRLAAETGIGVIRSGRGVTTTHG